MSSEWSETTLGGFVRLQRGHDLTASEQQPGPYPVMGSAGQNGSHNVAKAKGPGVVVGRSGASMGRVHYSESDYWPHNTCLYVTDFQGNNPRFAYYVLGSLDLAGYNSGSAQPSLNRNYIYGMPLKIPSRAQQDSIVEVLSALDDRIALLRETNATLEAIALALFKSWFVDFDPVHVHARGEEPAGLAPEVAALFPDSFEESELGMVPKGWKIGTLASVANFQNGYAFKSKDWRETGHPVVKIGDVKPGIIDFSGCSYIDPETTEGLSRFKLERGDLLVGMTGYVGETGLVPHVKPHAYLNQRVGRIATRSGLADLGFVYCLVRNPAFKGYAEAHSHGSAQANVSGAVLLDYATFIPTKDLLNHFNGVVGEMLESILSNHEQAQTLATLRDTLLPRLISGQLRLPEAEAQLSEAGLCQ
ncbi:restriction endonuclease subunit S [Aeromonas sanarellii]